MSQKLVLYSKRLLKFALYAALAICGFLLFVIVIIQVPSVQNFAKEKAIHFIENKIGTKVALSKISIKFPKDIVLEELFLEDQLHDTLISGKKVQVDVDLFQLINSRLNLNAISLSGVHLKLKKDSKGVFNFDYIIKAFQSPDPAEEDTTSKPFVISVDKINLDAIHFNYTDDVSKINLNLAINHFDTRFKAFDLAKMDFNIPRIRLDGLKVLLNQDILEKMATTSVQVADTLSKQNNLKLNLKEILLSNIDVAYDNQDAKMASAIKFDNLKLAFNTIDLQRQFIDIKGFDVKNVTGNFELGKKEKQINLPELDSTAIKQEGWRIKLHDLSLNNVAFKFDDQQSKSLVNGLDYNHLDIKKLNAKLQNFYFSNDTISGDLQNFQFNDRSGLTLENVRSQFFYGPKRAELTNLEIKTPKSLIRDHVKLTYGSIKTISKNIGMLGVDAKFKNSKVAFSDILLLSPDLIKMNPFKSRPNAILVLDADINGQVNDLSLNSVKLSGIGVTRVNLVGKIQGLPDAQKAYYKLAIKEFKSSSSDILSFLPPNTVPKSVQLPNKMALVGNFTGTIQNFDTKFDLTSSLGKANLKATFDQRIKNRERYAADVMLNNFNVGKIVRNDSIGVISLNATVKGTGLNPKTAQAQVNGLIKKAVFNKYEYRNLALKGAIAKGYYKITSGMNDPNLKFDLAANGSTKDKFPQIQLKLNLDIADLEKLNLHAGPMKLRGDVFADIPNSNPDFLNGKVVLNNIQVMQTGAPIVLDSIKMVAFSDSNQNYIKISAPFLRAQVDGKYKLSTLANSLQNSFATFIDLDKPKKKVTDHQQVHVSLAIHNDPILFNLLPKLKTLDPINLTGDFDSQSNTFSVNGTIPKIVYDENSITNASISLATHDSILDYKLSIAGIKSGSIQVPQTNFTGKIENNIVDFAFEVVDDKQKQQYFIAGNFSADKKSNSLKLDSNKLLLNYDPWNIDKENTIVFGKNALVIDHFFLVNSGNELKIQSQGASADAPIKVDFVNFEIGTLLNIVKKEELLMQGTINGSAIARNIMKSPIVTSDLKIDNFKFRDAAVGDLSIQLNNTIKNQIDAAVSLTGEGNQVDLKGKYFLDNSALDFKVNIEKLYTKSIQGFSMGNLSEGSGFLNGDFEVTGVSSSPIVNGEISFNETSFNVVPLNSKFKVDKETVTFSEGFISFDNFTLFDENQNELIVDGTIQSQDFSKFNFGLTITANDFRAIHSKAADNDLFYGDLFLDTKLQIKGTLDNPVVGGTLKINDKTKFTAVLPQSDPSIADREGIVEFVDEDNIYLKQTLAINEKVNSSEVKGLDVSVAISIDKNAELTLVIDKGNGDYLNLKGEAELIGGIDPSGKTTLTGKYEFSEGAYEMNFNMIRRKFDIEKGSYIIWNGEPTLATLNITAVYKVDTAPIDLLGNQLGTLAPAVKNAYKQKIPFQTLLKMNGELLKPEIKFDIVLPDANYDVSSDIVSASQTKLEQLRQEPSELNKQVFALLLLNRFIGENPFASESGGTSAESLARQSVSKILSQQLNDLAAELVSGVQLEFDLESSEDYTSGTMENRTDLNVGVSKKLLNDRLKVTVGSSFAVEGQERANEASTNIAGDVALDYQLTKDGRYMVRAYRKNQYQVAVEGQVVETGIAFIITMSYNKFRELFHRTAEERILLQKERERKERVKKAEKDTQSKNNNQNIESNEQKT